MYEDVARDYENGLGLDLICKKYKIGKIKAKSIIKSFGVEIRPKCRYKKYENAIVKDWNIEKYPKEEGYYYVAISKDDGTEFVDCDNRGGHLTKYVRDKFGIEVPTLYDRKRYYQVTGDYWWEQWFRVEKRKLVETKKCPYCDWETNDLGNKSGAFLVHLNKEHGKSVEEYLIEHPEDIEYFKKYSRKLKRENELKKEENYVICPICGEKYMKLTISHIEKFHGVPYDDFKEKYPKIKLTSERMHEQALETVKLGNLTVSKDRFVSKYEKEISKFLAENGVDFEPNRQILIGKEIDILIPEKRLGIEFDGLKWHTEFFGKKSHTYHLEKTLKCNEKGYGLIHIFEDEYVNHKEIVYSKLSHILGLDYSKPKVMGRKCSVKEILKNDAEIFLDKYHIQGFVSATVYLGAFYGNELVCVMSFKNGNIKNPDWELVRYASKDTYRYQGVGSKMFSYFTKKYEPKRVVSFADRRWTVNLDKNLYTNLGFSFDKFTRPDYRYYKDESKSDMKHKRIHKMYFNKKKLCKQYGFAKTMTEKEMALELGYDRIWDCGLIKYVWKEDINN